MYFMVASYRLITNFTSMTPRAAGTALKGDTAGLALDENLGVHWHSGCRCPISIPSPDSESWWKTTQGTFVGFLIKQELRLRIFLLVLYGVIGVFFRFRRFTSTMVALTLFLGKSVPDGGKWVRFGKPRTTRFTRDHRKHVERLLTCFAKPLTATACMAGGNNCSRAKRQKDVVIL